MTTIKPILKYPGAKWSKAEWIVSHLPPHTQYIEPYCGSAAIFLSKEPVEHEVLNDLDSNIVNLFRVVRERGHELADMIALTPWAREEYEASYTPTGDNLEDARRFLVRCWQAYATVTSKKTGWRHRGTQGSGSTSVLWRQLPDRLLAIIDRLKDAEIECRPALDIIAEYPDALIYADPPYVLSTRSQAMYEHEMDIQAHSDLLDALQQHRGPVILSGYTHPLYESHLANWQRVATSSVAEKGKVQTEVLWLNPQATQCQQLNLFEQGA